MAGDLISRRTLLSTLAALPLCGWVKPKKDFTPAEGFAECQRKRPELLRQQQTSVSKDCLWGKPEQHIVRGAQGLVRLYDEHGQETRHLRLATATSNLSAGKWVWMHDNGEYVNAFAWEV